MKDMYKNLQLASEHLLRLDEVFRTKANYSSGTDFDIYKENVECFERIASDITIKEAALKIMAGKQEKKGVSFADEIYHQSDRQMKLADLIEYLFFSRGIYFLFQSNQFRKDRVKIFLELILRFVNMLMIYETLTVDAKLRKRTLDKLKEFIKDEPGFKDLYEWEKNIGLPGQEKDAPNEYFDSLLPKTAGGLWHEMLVFAFILKFDIGYIFSLLLNQKPISLDNKLSPPDIIILHKRTFRYYGIEIGNLKERQSGGFMTPSGIPVIPLDTMNARVSDRCPTCSRWIGICPKVIKDFSEVDGENNKPKYEIRCLTECSLYTLEQKLGGACKYMKYRYDNVQWRKDFPDFTDGKHHHYHCCHSKEPDLEKKIVAKSGFDELKRLNDLLVNDNKDAGEIEEMKLLQEKLKYSFIKTHSVYYSELIGLIKMNGLGKEISANIEETNNE